MKPAARAPLGALLFNLIAVYILWGSTAPAIRYAVQTLPAYDMCDVRFLLAGTLLWTFVRVRGVAWPRGRDWLAAAATGTALLVLGNGIFAWTLVSLHASIASLFFCLAPFFMAFFAYIFERERLSLLGAVGLAVGFGGMVYLIAPSREGSLPLMPVIAGLFSAASWGFGSILQRLFPARDLVQASALQMLCAGPLLLLLGLCTGERMSLSTWTPHAVFAVLYLVGFGSIVGYSCYLWLMRNVPTTLASTYAYVNPIVAIALSVTFLHETLSARTAVAAAIVVAGVALMMLAPKPQPKVVAAYLLEP